MPTGHERDGDDHVSTGRLPPPDTVRAWLADAHARYAGDADGAPSQVYPALARMPADLFGIAVVATSGAVHEVGDATREFTIMSVSKPFVFALVCELLGAEEARARVGVNATGMPFDSVEAIARDGDSRTNPMVNPGALAATASIPGETTDARWQLVRDGLSRFAGRELALDDEVYASATATNVRNREIAEALARAGGLPGDPGEAVDLYTRQCSLSVTARDLAVMGATLADGGVNPVTGARVVSAGTCHHALAVMVTAGLYETSGDWLYDVGLPAKSGISGGIVTVSPGKGGMGTFAPRIDATGTSVKGRLAARMLSRRLGLDLLISAPET